jgi:phosphate transport system substrate-binding protein
MQSRILRFLIAAALSATACCQILHAAQGASVAPAVPAKLLISGSTTMAPMVSEMARRFEVLYPGTRVEVRSVGSGKGISDLRAGTSSIAMASRPLLDSERDLFAFPIARDGVALIVNRDNPVKGLSEQQARAIITGRINNWKTVGGRDAAVMLIWRAKGQGSVELLAEQLNFSHAEVSTQAAIVDNDALIKEVESHPSAITPLSVGQAERGTQAGARIKVLAFAGIAASAKTIRNGSYPLSRPLALVTRRLPEGAEKRFIDFALSGHVGDFLAKYDFVAYEE